jgi:hypothetical protein
LGTATETAVNFAGSARHGAVAGQRSANVVVGQHIAGTDDHSGSPGQRWYQMQLCYLEAAIIDFNQKHLLFSYSNLLTYLKLLAFRSLW